MAVEPGAAVAVHPDVRTPMVAQNACQVAERNWAQLIKKQIAILQEISM
jgi:hypothetical protein